VDREKVRAQCLGNTCAEWLADELDEGNQWEELGGLDELEGESYALRWVKLRMKRGINN
jgi:hypothetical protein